MMACPEPLDGWERSLAQTLGATKTYAIAGDTLVLMDEAGGGGAGDFQGGVFAGRGCR
jgi:heat shock protein HslJ